MIYWTAGRVRSRTLLGVLRGAVRAWWAIRPGAPRPSTYDRPGWLTVDERGVPVP